jgi:hypothetical protein
MDSRLHQQITAQFAIFGITTAIAVTAIALPARSPVDSVPVALAAQSEPLSPASTLSPPGLIGQQVAFHVAFATDFLSTGAELFTRELPIPLVLAADIASGKPVSASVARALRDFAAVELDAGKALVMFGAEYVEFQAQFVAGLVPRRSAGVQVTTLVHRTVGSPPETPIATLTHGSGTRGAVRRLLTTESVSPFNDNDAAAESVGTTTDLGHGNDFHVLLRLADRPSDQGASSTSARSGLQHRVRHDHHEHDRGGHD